MSSSYSIEYANLSLPAYWAKHSVNLAEWRNWKCGALDCPDRCDGCAKDCQAHDTRKANCTTWKTVDRLITRLAPYLPECSIDELSFLDVKYAVSSLQDEVSAGGRPYADQTVREMYAYLHDIFRYAEDHDHATDVMVEITSTEISNIVCAKNRGARKSVIAQYIEKLQKKPRSLTIWQIERLLDIVVKRVSEDGRAFAILLALFLGLRPAELRFLRWRDVITFADHKDRFYAAIMDSRDEKARRKHHVKTRNGNRKIPIPTELLHLLHERYKYVSEECRKRGIPQKEYRNYPIVCYENQFHRPCRDYELSKFIKPIFKRIQMSMDDLVPYLIDLLAEDELGELTDESDEVMTLYVLRRTFWTLMNSCTQLSDEEKRYIMGHEIKVNNKDQRKRFNNENVLWGIGQKMDRCVCSGKLHARSMLETLTCSCPVEIVNRGIIYLNIPRDLLTQGGELVIDAITEECADDVTLTILQSPRAFAALRPQIFVLPYPPSDRQPSGINTEYEVWQAHQKPARPDRAVRPAVSAEPVTPPT